MIKDIGAFVAGMALKEQKEKEGQKYLDNSQSAEATQKAKEAFESAQQYQFYGITKGLF